MDESAFYLLPAVVSTWAPVGQTPRLRTPLTRDHLSALGAVTPSGAVSVRLQERSVTGRDVVRFLGHLKRVLGEKLLVLMDGASIHKSAEVSAFLGSAAGAGIKVASLPAYAPEVNPSEGLWRYSKQALLGNVCSHDFGELKQKVRAAMQRLRGRPELIRAFFKQALL
jgi:transposase